MSFFCAGLPPIVIRWTFLFNGTNYYMEVASRSTVFEKRPRGSPSESDSYSCFSSLLLSILFLSLAVSLILFCYSTFLALSKAGMFDFALI